jgi:NAD(P)H-flavin reductase
MDFNHRLKVVSNNEIAPDILLLIAKGEKGLPFLGGQYFSFRIADRVNRSYSIASAPGAENIEFVVDICPGGPGSVFVKNLKPGDEFDVMGPFGFFTLEKSKAFENDEPIIFIATGTGIAPLKSMILDLFDNKKTKREIFLFYGLRYDNEEYFFKDFHELSEKFPNFFFNPVISRPTKSWNGNKGYVQDYILQMPVIETAKVYICGSNKNVDAINAALVEHGYPKENIFFEKFG